MNIVLVKLKKLENFLSDDTFVLEPAMSNPFKVNNVYHHQCIIKYKKDNKLRDTLIMLDNHYKFNNKINVEIDIDPNKC